MKRVLVLGSEGLLGSAVCRTLQGLPGIEILAPRSSELELRNAEETNRYFLAEEPDTVFHCAASVFGLGGNAHRQFEVLSNNVTIDVNVLSSCRNSFVRRIGYAGSVAGYGYPYRRLPLREDDFFWGDPHYGEYGYGAEKRLAANMLTILAKEYQKAAVFGCLTNLYGPNDRYNVDTGHVIPSLIKRCFAAKRNGTDFEVWGDGSARRDFLYADDAAKALVHLTERGATGVVNIASGQSVRIADIVGRVVDSMGYAGRVAYDASRPTGIADRSVDIGKLIAAGYRPETRLVDGIATAVKWYVDNAPASRK